MKNSEFSIEKPTVEMGLLAAKYAICTGGGLCTSYAINKIIREILPAPMSIWQKIACGIGIAIFSDMIYTKAYDFMEESAQSYIDIYKGIRDLKNGTGSTFELSTDDGFASVTIKNENEEANEEVDDGRGIEA